MHSSTHLGVQLVESVGDLWWHHTAVALQLLNVGLVAADLQSETGLSPWTHSGNGGVLSVQTSLTPYRAHAHKRY